jgi:hypothetical protein
MISAPAGITLDGATRATVCDDTVGRAVGRVVGGVVFAAASNGGVAAGKFQVAALRARMVAGDVASPGTRAVGASGVLGGIGERDSVVAKDVALLNVGMVWDVRSAWDVDALASSSSSRRIGSCRLCWEEAAELVNDDPRGSLKTGGGGVGIASSFDGFLRLLDWVVEVVLASFFGLPRFWGTCGTPSDNIASTSSAAAVALFFGLARFFGALAGVVASASIESTDADADAPDESDAATVAFCFLCRFAGSAVVRCPSGSPCFRKQSSIVHSTRPAGSKCEPSLLSHMLQSSPSGSCRSISTAGRG